jgi:hypothetical protein
MHQVAAVALLLATASFAAGTLLGFLFGIPKALQTGDGPGTDSGEQQGRTYAVNTNLEQISDWLTKILVGIGLIQLGEIRDATQSLVQVLAPAFGGGAAGGIVASLDLAFFVSWGFLVGYLLTRTYLTAAFRAFDLEAITQKAADLAAESVSHEAELREIERARVDAGVLALVGQQLRPRLNEPSVTLAELRNAVSKCSPSLREQIFAEARNQRRENWKWSSEYTESGRPDETKRRLMDRTIPVFEALIFSDESDDRCHAELGFALRDQKNPDLRRAIDEMTTAIRLGAQNNSNHSIDFLVFNRARAQVQLDVEDPDSGVDRQSVIRDLQRAGSRRSAATRGILQGDEMIRQWLVSLGRDMGEVVEPDVQVR